MIGRITNYIDFLREKPEEERIQYAYYGAVVVVGCMFVAWAAISLMTMQAPDTIDISVPTVRSVQETVDSIIEDAQTSATTDTGSGTMPTTHTDLPLPAPTIDTPEQSHDVWTGGEQGTASQSVGQ